MSMTRTNPFLSAKAARILSAGLLAVCSAAAPALAQEPASQPEMAFGQPMPRHYFLNKLTGPSHDQAPEQASGGAAGGGQGGSQASGGQGGTQARTQAAEEEGNGPFPKRYLLNRMFSSDDFGEEPASSGRSAPAPAPAAKSP